MSPELLTDVAIERQNLYVALGAFGLFLLMALGHLLLFKGWKGGGPLMEAVRDRWRWLSLPLLVVIPLWWAATQTHALFHTSAELFLIACFLFVVLILEGLRTVLSEKLKLSGPALILLLYLVPTLVFLASVLQLDVLDSANLYATGTVLVLFLALHLIYTYLFKWVPWKHPLSIVLRERIGVWVYLGIVGVTVYFALVRFPTVSGDERLLAGLGGILGLLALLVASEAVLTTLFDFYFPVSKKSEVPSLFRDLIRGLVYIGLFLLFVGAVLKRDIDSLLVGSAVLTVSIGFALQETLGNFFAGLALRLSKPYELGDFIRVGGVSGRVSVIDWRQTSIRTFSGDYMVLPNSLLAKEAFVNHSAPSELHARDIRFRVHLRHPPNLVIETVKEALAKLDIVLDDPAAEVFVLEFGDFAINYRIRYWMNDYGGRHRHDTDVRTALWYAFKRKGLEIPFPTHTLINQVKNDEPKENLDEVLGFLTTVDFLEALGPEKLEVLARQARFQLFAAGEKICIQGHPGDSFYIIREGKVLVVVRNAEQDKILDFEMSVGNYFGEMALLTGEPRSATVSAVTDAELLTVSKEDLREVIVAHPEVEKIISKVLAQRQLRTEQAREVAEEERANRAAQGGERGARTLEQLSEQLLAKIQAFFSY